ncbi:hypothetical protein LV780_20895 (plasmid) [Cereibacter azotoformans]|uniref:hypothetical protein n=1 Tax=Cereibacter azotoformans TaxID=43057 RepID=UPI000D35F95F|nr:hypothetical protein [Cereibacter azotoformans]AXQ96286.1 hypothetical protein D0Z66_21300 [Cereibacter sphaeroides]UIJ33201.1 hypothetical protein LV780_20895 [Cereibacter azotoformans]
MSGTMSRARQIAETAFSKTQSHFLDRTRALREQDAELSERANITRRLRIARLEREQAGKAISSLPSKKQRANPA